MLRDAMLHLAHCSKQRTLEKHGESESGGRIEQWRSAEKSDKEDAPGECRFRHNCVWISRHLAQPATSEAIVFTLNVPSFRLGLRRTL